MKLLSYTNIKNLAHRPVLFSGVIIITLILIAKFTFFITFLISNNGVNDLITQEEKRNLELISSNKLAQNKLVYDSAVDTSTKKYIDENWKDIKIIASDSVINPPIAFKEAHTIINYDTIIKDTFKKNSQVIDSVNFHKSSSIIRLINKPIYESILNNQAELNAEHIIYSIKQSFYHLSFYKGLISVIIVFTTLMSISIFMISHKGWNGSSIQIKVFALTVIILLGLANLINTVIKPKQSFNAYAQSVKKSSDNQIKIFNLINDYNKIPMEKMDSVISRNFNDLNSNVDLLPNIDEEKISSSSIDIKKVTGM